MGHPSWESSAQGISLGGYGLSIRTEDIANFGQLYLQQGRWNGRQLIPAAWVAEATSLQIANGSDPDSDWDQGYCYQFWRCTHGFYRGDGAFGQYCLVMPQYDAVMAMTSATKDLQGVLSVVWSKVVPAFSDAALPADAASDHALAEKLAALTLPVQAGRQDSPGAAAASGRRYTFAPNKNGIEWVQLDTPAGGPASISARMGGEDIQFACGKDAWAKGTIPSAMGPVPVAATGAWSSDDTYTFTLCRYRTPFLSTLDLRFSGDTLILEMEDNVGLEGTPRIRLTGTAQPRG
jgi:hypothetical protein